MPGGYVRKGAPALLADILRGMLRARDVGSSMGRRERTLDYCLERERKFVSVSISGCYVSVPSVLFPRSSECSDWWGSGEKNRILGTGWHEVLLYK